MNVNISTTGKIITMWGVLVLAGWLLATLPLALFGQNYTTSVLQMWTVLMVIGLAVTYKWFPEASDNKVVRLWTVLIAGYLLLNWANWARLLPASVSPYVYLHGWLLITAIGFALTAMWWTPKSKTIYAAGAIANLVLLILILARFPGVAKYNFLLVALAGGVPIIADGLLNYRTPQPAKTEDESETPSSAPVAPAAPFAPVASATPATPVVRVVQTPAAPATAVTVHAVPAFTPAKPSTGKKVIVRIVSR